MAEKNERRPEGRGNDRPEEARSPRQHPTGRDQLIRDPNLNQADNGRGSADQTQGSQTGNDVDPVPEP
jgi:hypothetical protein